MRDTNYAYAVANVRAMEPNLLSKSFMEQIADANDYDSAMRMISDGGIDGFEDYMAKTWDFLSKIAPDVKGLEFLIVKNDFHNLKAIIKGIISGNNGTEYCIKPCVLNIDELEEGIRQKDFEALPKWISKTAEESYGLLTSTMDGQLFDMFVDKASLLAIKDFAKFTENEFAVEIAELFIALSNIKIAVRIAGSQRGKNFLENAFAKCDSLETDELKKAVLKGKDSVLEYINTTKYSNLCESISNSVTEFERQCDNMIMELLEGAKNISFGPEPLICYYFARETEWKMLRIITSGKYTELDREVIRERMRELYV